MRYVRLIATHDEYGTEPGLSIKGTPQVEGFAADRTGTLIAHDLLEHVNGTEYIGYVWDEMEALGAIWQVRGRHGDLMTGRSVYGPARSIANDFVRMFNEDHSGEYIPPTHRIGRSMPHLYDEDFQDIIKYAQEDLRREYDEATEADFDEYLKDALPRLRRGFRKAERKYGSGFDGYEMFRRVKDAVGVITPDYEGQEFRLAYSPDRAYVEEII